MAITPIEGVAGLQQRLFEPLRLDLHNPLVRTNADAENAHHWRRIMAANAARQVTQPAVCLCRYPPATVVDGHPETRYSVLSAGHLVHQQIPDDVADPAGLAAAIAARGRDAPLIEAPCLLAARYGDVVWGHWLLEMLPKIIVAEHFFPQKFTYVIPSRLDPPGETRRSAYFAAVADSLQAYRIAPHRLLRLPPGRALQFAALFDISGISSRAAAEPHFGPHPQVIALMNNGIVVAGDASLPPRPYITRNSGDARQLANADEVAAILAQHGYHAVDLTALAFSRQVALFRQARCIAGVLGSGLAGLVFARPQTRLVTLAPIHWLDQYFPNIIQKRHIRHTDLRGRPSDGAALSPISAFVAPAAALAEALASEASLPD